MDDILPIPLWIKADVADALLATLVVCCCLSRVSPAVGQSIDQYTINISFNGSIGDSSATGWVTPTCIIAKGTDLFYLSTYERQGEIRVFNMEGRFVREFGRVGFGPGEWNHVRALEVIQEDTLLVADVGNSRISVATSDDPSIRTIPLPLSLNEGGMWLLRDNRLLVNAYAFTRESIAYPLHLYNLSTGERFSIGHPKEEPYVMPKSPEVSSLRFVCEANELGHIWSVRGVEYLLEEWDLDSGDRTKSMGMPTNHFDNMKWEIRGLAKITDEILVVLIRLRERDVPSSGEALAHVDRYYDTLLEAVDTGSGRVLARGFLDEMPLRFVEGPELLTFRSGEGERSGVINRWMIQLP